MKQISSSNRNALLLSFIVCTMLYSPMIEAQQKMYWTDIETDKIQRADLDGNNIEDLITTGLSIPLFTALDVSDSSLPFTIDITAVPNPATVGQPLDILLDVDNPGPGFDAKFRLWALANANLTTLVSISPFVPADFTLTDFPVFSTVSVPAGLPPVIGFLAAMFDAGSGESIWPISSPR